MSRDDRTEASLLQARQALDQTIKSGGAAAPGAAPCSVAANAVQGQGMQGAPQQRQLLLQLLVALLLLLQRTLLRASTRAPSATAQCKMHPGQGTAGAIRRQALAWQRTLQYSRVQSLGQRRSQLKARAPPLSAPARGTHQLGGPRLRHLGYLLAGRQLLLQRSLLRVGRPRLACAVSSRCE